MKTNFKIIAILLIMFKVYSEMIAQQPFKQSNPSTKQLTGYIIKETNINNETKIEERTDYYFQLIVNNQLDKKIFIKLSDSDVSQTEIDNLLVNKKSNELKSNILDVIAQSKKGLYDVPENEQEKGLQYQSRNGDYLNIKYINNHKSALITETTTPISFAEQGTALELIGHFHKNHQVNKAGKILKTYNYYFIEEKTKKKYVVKISECALTKDSIDKHLFYAEKDFYTSHKLKIGVVLKNGLLDNTNNTNQQSKKGEYITIQSISTMKNILTKKGAVTRVLSNTNGSKNESTEPDYYFQETLENKLGEKYFIKLSDSKVSQKIIDSLLDKRTDFHFEFLAATVEIEIHDGLWDVPQAEQEKGLKYQSRTGKYITIESLTPTKIDDGRFTKIPNGYGDILEGQILKKLKVNRGGKTLKNYDYFFKPNNSTDLIFIKLIDSKITKETLDKYAIEGKDNNVKINAINQNGLWDTNDRLQQSRFGKYLTILSIEEIN